MDRNHLPLTRPLTLAYTLSLVVVLMMAGISLASLLIPGIIYPTEELHNAFVTNDMINLFIGVPILIGSLWLTRMGKLVGLLFWPGALLYSLYNYLANLFGVPLSWVSLIYLTIVLLCACAIYEILRSMDQECIKGQLSGYVPVKIAGWVLVGMGMLFFALTIGMNAPAIANHTGVTSPETGLLVADTFLSTLCIIGGILLLLRRPLGYVGGLGLLFGASMLFVGVILVLLLRPLLTDVPFDPGEILVLLAMGMVSFIPFGLYLRGVQRSAKTSQNNPLPEI